MEEMMKGIENKMEYAIQLSSIGENYPTEDFFKLACLCEEIKEVKNLGESPGELIENEFNEKIMIAYIKSGILRSEIERFKLAKELIISI